MSRYSVSQLGWQYAVRCNGVLVRVFDTKEEASAEARRLGSNPQSSS